MVEERHHYIYFHEHIRTKTRSIILKKVQERYPTVSKEDYKCISHGTCRDMSPGTQESIFYLRSYNMQWRGTLQEIGILLCVVKYTIFAVHWEKTRAKVSSPDQCARLMRNVVVLNQTGAGRDLVSFSHHLQNNIAKNVRLLINKPRVIGEQGHLSEDWCAETYKVYRICLNMIDLEEGS